MKKDQVPYASLRSAVTMLDAFHLPATIIAAEEKGNFRLGDENFGCRESSFAITPLQTNSESLFKLIRRQVYKKQPRKLKERAINRIIVYLGVSL